MAEEVKIDITVSAGKGQKTVKDFKKDIEGVGTAAKKMGSDLKVGLDVRQRLRDLQNRMAEIGDVGSKEFQNLAREAGGLKDQMNNANAAIKSMSADFPKLQLGMSADFPKLQLGVQGLQAMGAAAQATVAAQSLLGTENEEVTKSIQKMMALQAVSNSLMQFSNLLSDESALGLAWRKTKLFQLTKQIKAFNIRQKVMNFLMKAFNFITASNPLVKLIVILAAVAAGFVFLASKVKVVKDFFVGLGARVHNLIESMGAWKNVILALLGPIGWLIAAWDFFFGEQAAALDDQMRAEQAAFEEREKLGKENAKLHREEINRIKEEQAARKEAFEDQQEIFDLDIARMEAEGQNADALKKLKIEAILEEEQAELETINNLIEKWTSFYKQQAIIAGKSEEEYIEILKGRGIDVDALHEEALEAIEVQNRKIFAAETNLIALEKGARTTASKDRVKNTEESLAIIEKLENAYTDSLLDNQTRQENAIRDKYFAAIELARANGIDTTLLEEAQLQELTDIRAKFKQQEQDVLDEMQDEFDAIELEKEKEKQLKKQQIKEAAFQSAEALLSAAESLNTIFHGKELKRIEAKKKRGEKLTASEEKRLAKEAKIQKAFALVQIAIDTAKAIAGAVAAGASQPFPLNIAAIISGVAAVLANVAAASELMSAPPPSISASGGGDIAGLTEDASQDAPVQALTEGSTLLNNEVQQVVVVESITDGINSVGVIEAQASFG